MAPPAGLCDEQDSQNHHRPNILTKQKGWTWAESHHIWIFTLFEVFQRIHLQRDFIVWIPPFMLNRHFIEPTTTTSEERTIENQIVKISIGLCFSLDWWKKYRKNCNCCPVSPFDCHFTFTIWFGPNFAKLSYLIPIEIVWLFNSYTYISKHLQAL